jgi:pilus assembly protein Flp/PilA
MLTSFEYLAGWVKTHFAKTDRGAALVEYALLLALIAVVCIVAINAIGGSANSAFESINTELENVNAP